MLSLKKAALALTSVSALALSVVVPQAAFAATDGTITFTDENATATVKLVDDKGNEIGTFAGRTYSSLYNLDDEGIALKDAAPIIPNYYLTQVCVDGNCEAGALDVQPDSKIEIRYTPYTPASVSSNTDLSSTLSKEAVDNGDGKTYTQTGTFKIANGKTSGNGNTRAVDVLFLIDESGSMDFDALEVGLTNALNAFSANKSIDVNFGLVTLADYGRTVVPLGATDVAAVKQGFEAIKNDRQYGSGDDLSTGLVQARHELARARVGAQKVVVFLGDDGAVEDGSGHFVGNDGSSWNYTTDASEYAYQLERLPLGPGDIMYVAEIDSYTTVMEDFSKLPAHKSSIVFGKGDEAGFFENFTVDMVALEATNIAVTDTLSDNVELVSKDITLTVTDASGKEVASGVNTVTLPATSTNKEATLAASVSADGKTITVAFPADYKSEDGWSYSFSEQLTLSASAPTGDAALADTSDPNTGTWAESKGLFTSVRESSKVTYTTGSGMERSDVFPMPVVVKPVAYDAADDPTPTATPTPTPTATPKPIADTLAKTGTPVVGGLIGGLFAVVGLYLVGMRRRAMR